MAMTSDDGPKTPDLKGTELWKKLYMMYLEQKAAAHLRRGPPDKELKCQQLRLIQGGKSNDER
jgi:hypothetical protein